MNKQALLKKYNKLEDNNDHNEAAMLLIKAFGTQDEVDQLKSIMAAHRQNGYMLASDIDIRYNISQKYYKLLHEPESNLHPVFEQVLKPFMPKV
jgi:hypothetical protein